MKVLIVEDDLLITNIITAELEKLGFDVDKTTDGIRAMNMLLATDYAMVILDLMLPGINGDEVCKQLRVINPRISIIAISALTDLNSKVKMFNCGADDYMPKPLAMPELVARIKAALRKQQIEITAAINYEDLELNIKRHEVKHKGQKIELRDKEIKILEYLMRHAEQVLTREMILYYAWGPNIERFTNVVDVHIHSLRNKIDKPFGTKLLRTINNVGYKLSK